MNLAQIPLGVALMAPAGAKPSAALIDAARQPLVFVPLIATAIVVAGIQFPAFADAPLALIGQANSGVAVFAAGLVLSAHKFSIRHRGRLEHHRQTLADAGLDAGARAGVGIHRRNA